MSLEISDNAKAIAYLVAVIRPGWLRADVEKFVQERLNRGTDVGTAAAAAIDAARNPNLLLPVVIRTHTPPNPAPATQQPPNAERCESCRRLVCACGAAPPEVARAAIDAMKANLKTVVDLRGN